MNRAPRYDCSSCGHDRADHAISGSTRCLRGERGGYVVPGQASCSCQAYRYPGLSEVTPRAEGAALGDSVLGSIAGSIVGGFLGAAVGSARDDGREVEALRRVAEEARAVVARERARSRRDKGFPARWLGPLDDALGRLDRLGSQADPATRAAQTQSGRSGDGPRPVTTRGVEATKRR